MLEENAFQIQLCVCKLKSWALTSCALLLSSVVSSSIRFLLGSDSPWVTAPTSVLSDWLGCGGLDGGAAGGSSSRQKGWILGISGPAFWEAVWMGLHGNNNTAKMMCCHSNRQVVRPQRWEKLSYWLMAVWGNSPAASLSLGQGGSRWSRGPGVAGGCGQGDGGHPAPHWGWEGCRTPCLHLHWPAAASRGGHRCRRGLLRSAAGKKGAYQWHHHSAELDDMFTKDKYLSLFKATSSNEYDSLVLCLSTLKATMSQILELSALPPSQQYKLLQRTQLRGSNMLPSRTNTLQPICFRRQWRVQLQIYTAELEVLNLFSCVTLVQCDVIPV